MIHVWVTQTQVQRAKWKMNMLRSRLKTKYADIAGIELDQVVFLLQKKAWKYSCTYIHISLHV